MTATGHCGRQIVLVTGASGCLGHATVRLLLAREPQVCEIRCLDLIEPSAQMRQELDEELAKVANKQPTFKRLKFIKGDVRDINIVEQTLAGGVNCVMHCAARQEFWVEPRDQPATELESTNVAGTENLLKACVRLGVPKFVHVSSFETFVSWHTIYYATESTIPDPQHLLFGPSAETKRTAELKVRQYANVKLKRQTSEEQQLDSLRAVILRFTPIYGEHDRHYVSKLLELTKFFGGKLQRFTNIWIRQQPIYVGNAAWALLCANRRLDLDESISGEEFHITDETPIGDPFDFMEPFVKCRGMEVSKSTYPAWPVWFLLVLFSWLRGCLGSLDVFGLFTSKQSRLDEAIEQDERRLAEQLEKQRQQQQNNQQAQQQHQSSSRKICRSAKKLRWYNFVTPQNFYFMCNSLFLNRTKASLRLDYEPSFNADEALRRSLDWYKNHLELAYGSTNCS